MSENTRSDVCASVECRRDRNESANLMTWNLELILNIFDWTEEREQSLTSLFCVPVHCVSRPSQPEQRAADRWEQPGCEHHQCRQMKPCSSSKWKAQLCRIMSQSTKERSQNHQSSFSNSGSRQRHRMNTIFGTNFLWRCVRLRAKAKPCWKDERLTADVFFFFFLIKRRLMDFLLCVFHADGFAVFR